MVATPSNLNAACTAVAASRATSGAGTRFRKRAPSVRMASANKAMPVVAGLIDGSASSSAHNFSWKCRPEGAGFRPKKSFH